MSRVSGCFDSVESVLIIGPGLIGGSVGLGLRAAAFRGRILGVDRSRRAIRAAVAAGAIDEGLATIHAAPADTSLILVAVPPDAFAPVVREIAAWRSERSRGGVRPVGGRRGRSRFAGAEGPVVTDVTSVKGGPVSLATLVLGNSARFVGGHPMAGSERSGVAAARADLFRGAKVILTPTRRTSAGATAVVEGMWRALGGDVVRMSPGQHDRAVARVSHLAYVMATALMHAADRDAGAFGGRSRSTVEIAGPGLRDTTRVAASDAGLWRSILTMNQREVRRAIRDAMAVLRRIDRSLSMSDERALEAILVSAKRLREKAFGG